VLKVSSMLLPAEREVWLNPTESRERCGFTLVHEIGHQVCRVLEGRGAPVMCRADEIGMEGRALEREANVFAAKLLMPEELVRAGCDGTAAGKPSPFGVSEEAMDWRFYNCGLVRRPA
jgi:Zn-dependent peptidase ImmA (M78 family)